MVSADGRGGSVGSTEGEARAVLGRACGVVGLEASGAGLVRLGSNAVFRLAAGDVLARVALGSGGLSEAERTVRVAGWLAEEGFPAARLAAGAVQPVVVDGGVVTFWVNVQDREAWASLPELADLLRRLHWLEEPESLGLPYYEPLVKVRRALSELEAVGAVPGRDVEFLRVRAAGLSEAYDGLDFVLPFGVIHGDANVGNAIRDRGGRALLIDLDDVSLGHREWDLVLTALYFERFGWHSRAEYEGFVRHYGFDLVNWPGFGVLADVRELMMTLWMGRKAASDRGSAEEFRRRVETLRTGGSRRGWKPF